jgi:hypothetical protein
MSKVRVRTSHIRQSILLTRGLGQSFHPRSEELVNNQAFPNSQPPRNRSCDSKGPHAVLRITPDVGDDCCYQIPFLARGLCTEQAQYRTFRHALESVFWTFVYILACFRGGRFVRNLHVKGWWTSGWDRIRALKHQFLYNSTQFVEPFARSIGVDPRPLQRCVEDLAHRVAAEQLDAAFLLLTLEEARNGYSSVSK